MKEFSVTMSLMDYIPVFLFLAGTILLLQDLYGRLKKAAFILFSAGTINIFTAGFLKATYKLLYAMGICDFEPLNVLFFPLQSIGFLLAGIAMIMYMSGKKEKTGVRACSVAVVPVLWKGTVLFISLMMAGLAGMCAGLIKLCASLKKKRSSLLFVVTFICSCCMGYLSSKSFDKALWNWIAEGINVIGQGCFLLGALAIHKALKAETAA